MNPYGLYRDARVVRRRIRLDRKDLRTFKVSRMEGDIRFATRRERDFRIPKEFDVDVFRGRPEWQIAEEAGEAKIEMAHDTAWWVEREFGERGRFEGDVRDAVLIGRGADVPILRQDGRARPVEPDELAGALPLRCARCARCATRRRPPRPELRARATVRRRATGPVVPERFGVLQALLAYLLARCGDAREAEIPRRSSSSSTSRKTSCRNISPALAGELRRRLLRGLRRAPGRCRARGQGTLRRRVPSAAADAARGARDLLALDFVGPMIAAQAHSPLDRVRKKLEETFGQFDSAGAEPDAATEEKLVATLSRDPRAEAGRDRVPEGRRGDLVAARRRAVPVRAPPAALGRAHVDRTKDGERSFRLDRMRNAKLTRETFERRVSAAGAETRRRHASGTRRRSRASRSSAATALRDGSAVQDVRFGSEEWLLSEILADRGEAVVLEPEELRPLIAKRAKELANELGVSRLRVPVSSLPARTGSVNVKVARGRGRLHLEAAAVRLGDRARDEQADALGTPRPLVARPNFSKISPCRPQGCPGRGR